MNSAIRRMIGIGIPISQSRAPLPKPMILSSFCVHLSIQIAGDQKVPSTSRSVRLYCVERKASASSMAGRTVAIFRLDLGAGPASSSHMVGNRLHPRTCSNFGLEGEAGHGDNRPRLTIIRQVRGRLILAFWPNVHHGGSLEVAQQALTHPTWRGAGSSPELAMTKPSNEPFLPPLKPLLKQSRRGPVGRIGTSPFDSSQNRRATNLTTCGRRTRTASPAKRAPS